MEIKIDNYIYNISCRSGERIKIYTVPENYSEDEIFIARWAHGEVEPVPGCLGCDARLVADGSFMAGESGALQFSGFLAEGVVIDA